jgi:hypothetical protein
VFTKYDVSVSSSILDASKDNPGLKGVGMWEFCEKKADDTFDDVLRESPLMKYVGKMPIVKVSS